MVTHVIEEDIVPSKQRTTVLVARILDYCFGLLYGVLAIRLVLEFMNARKAAGFTRFIDSITDPFYAPFRSIVGTDNVEGAHLVWPLIIAILAYMLLHAALRGLLRLAARA